METPTFGQWLQAQLRQHGWSQWDLASALNLAQATISRWQTGRSHPHPVFFPAIAQALGVSLDEVRAAAASEADVPPSQPDLVPSAEFGQWLQQQLTRRRWSQRDLAERAGLSPVTILTWVNSRRVPTPFTLPKLAQALGLTADEVRAAIEGKVSESLA